MAIPKILAQKLQTKLEKELELEIKELEQKLQEPPPTRRARRWENFRSDAPKFMAGLAGIGVVVTALIGVLSYNNEIKENKNRDSALTAERLTVNTEISDENEALVLSTLAKMRYAFAQDEQFSVEMAFLVLPFAVMDDPAL